jgi:hypothetical protein
MSVSDPPASIAQRWRAQDGLSKIIIALSLLLIVFAYLPTLRHDYVALDQWRAFRYSVVPARALDRIQGCADSNALYYSRTGRPLLWLSECAEHAAITRISDFAVLRPVALAILVAASLYLGTALAPFVGGSALGVVAASAFALSPACAFFYFQGVTGSAVVLCLILAAASFRRFRGWLHERSAALNPALPGLIASAALFFVGCLIYPSWMFLVVSLSLIASSADIQVSRATMLKRLCATLFFFASVALLYYAFEHRIEAVLEESTRAVPNMGAYSMSAQVNSSVILARIKEAGQWFWQMPPLNFDAPHGSLAAALVLFCARIGFRDRGHGNVRPGARVLAAVAIFVAGSVVLVGSIAPWLFSHMDYMATRFAAPWYLFFCAVVVGIISSAAHSLTPKFRRFAPALALLLFLLPVALRQERLSTLETQVSGLEIETMRGALAQWLGAKGYERQRYLLVVQPPLLRPAFAQAILGSGGSAGENARLSSAQSAAVVPWMIVAVLREHDDHPVGRSVNLHGCVFDQSCVDRALRDPFSVVIGLEDSVHVIRTSAAPYVINLSAITARPIIPAVAH